MRKLDSKINWYVFFLRSFVAVFVYAFLVITILIPKSEFEVLALKYVLIGIASFLTLLTVFYHLIIPFYTYKVYGYEINEDEIRTKRGVIFRRETVLPIKRIQHVELVEGPVQMLLKQATIKIFTAGSVEAIWGLSKSDALDVLKEIQTKLNIYLNLDEELKDE